MFAEYDTVFLDNKSISNIYKLILGRNTGIIDNICQKRKDEISVNLESFAIRKSFSRDSMTDDIYFRYIQIRTLHRRFYTNNVLSKMKVTDSFKCDLCEIEEDSNEHMLIQCKVERDLWDNIESWILEIGVCQFEIYETVIIFGEIDKANWLNAVLLNTKKVILNATIEGNSLSLEAVKRNVQLMFNYERLNIN